MDLERFENSINDKFKNFEPEIDDNMIWDAIEGGLPSKEEKRKKPFWLFGLFLLPAAYYLFVYNGADQMNTMVSEVSTNVQNERVETKQQTADTKTINIPSDEKDLGEANPHLTKVEKEITTDKVTKTNANLTEVNTVYKPARNVKSSITSSVDQDSVTTFAEATTEGLQAEETEDVKSEKVNSSEEAMIITNPIEDADTKNSGAEIIDLVEEQAVLMLDDDEAKYEDSIEKSIHEKAVETNKVNEIVTNDVKVAAKELDPKTTLNEDDSMAVKKKEMKFRSQGRLSLTGGAYLANRLYEQASDPSLVATIAEKENIERQLETIQLGLEYKHNLSERFALGLGLRFWRLMEESTYIVERDFQEVVDVLTEVLHHVDGTTDQTFISVPVDFNEQIEHTRYQTHTSFAVPVKAYYALVLDAKKRVELGLGYEQSISGKHEGYELVGDRTEYLITEDIDGNYANSGGNFLLASLSADYKINNTIQFTAGLEGKYGLDGFNTESAIFRKKYHFLGLYAGLNYTF